MPEWLLPVLGVAVTLALGLLTVQATRRSGDRERIGAVEKRLDQQDSRNLRWQNYAGALRNHIEEEKGPPAPDYPSGLFD